MVSESEEMYLVSIARAQEQGIEGPVPLAWIAEALDIQPVSVNQMIRKLEENGLVVYTPYKGVDLTTQGRQQANQVLRNRRLWEVFLVEQLKIAEEEANTLACRMEHVFSDTAIEKLAAYLGNPILCPDGKTIPSSAFEQPLDNSRSLSELPVQASGKVTRIEADSAIRSFLKNNGITVGLTLMMMGKGHQGDCLIANEPGGTIHLSSAIARTIYLQVEDE